SRHSLGLKEQRVTALPEGELGVLGHAGMKRKMLSRIKPRGKGSPRNGRARQEIRSFLLAVKSYPHSVARGSGLTFRQYLYNLLARARDDRSSQRANHLRSSDWRAG